MEGMIVNLATLGGAFPLEQREMAVRFGAAFCRNRSYLTEEEACAEWTKYGFATPCEPRCEEGKWTTPLIFKDEKHFTEYYHRKQPTSVELGPVHLTGRRVQDPLLRYRSPLVVDVDMDGIYAARRSCGCPTDKNICNVCWEEVLLPAMREIHRVYALFDFKAVLTVFSGRRGFHVWVLDREVWDYTLEQRAAIFAQFRDVRIDSSVSKSMTHLIKVPLIRHPATGLRAIPIDETFRPEQYPDVDLGKCLRFIEKKIRNGRDS